MNQALTMNQHQLAAAQYKQSMKEYAEALEHIDTHYAAEMKAEAESFERLQKEFEARMTRMTKFKDESIAKLKEQYAIEPS